MTATALAVKPVPDITKQWRANSLITISIWTPYPTAADDIVINRQAIAILKM